MRIADISCRFVCSLLILGHLGCSTFGKLHTEKKSAKSPTIQFAAWLAPPILVPIQSNSTLALAMTSPEIDSSRAGTRILEASMDSIARRHFENGCIILNRANVYWYFFDPVAIMEIFTGPVSLDDGDKVYSLPFIHSKFVTEKPISPVVYLLRDLDGSIQPISVDPNSNSMRLQIPFSTAVDGWSVTLVTRVEDNNIHHLVLPAPTEDLSAEARSLLSTLRILEVEPTLTTHAVFIKTGDVIEYLTKQEFQRKLL